MVSLYTVRQTGNVKIFSRMGFEVVSEAPANGLESDVFEQLVEVRMEKRLTP